MEHITHMKKRVLLIDDEVVLLSVLERSLSSDFEVKTASSGLEALSLCQQTRFDILVMDVNMPENDGFQTLSRIRMLDAYKKTPVLFLSGRGEIDSKLIAFDLGAKDYMLKPVHTKELKARIKVHLDRANGGEIAEDIIIEGPLVRFHVGENRVLIKETNQFVDLTKIECGILRLLMENPEKVISREKLLESVWGDQLNVLQRTVDAHIKKIRKKLGSVAELIESIHGVGYRYTPESRNKVLAA